MASGLWRTYCQLFARRQEAAEEQPQPQLDHTAQDSSLPVPSFQEPLSFSSRKLRPTPRHKAPPRPPAKTCPRSFGRIHKNTSLNHPQAVSFREDSDTSFLTSGLYNQYSKELYFQQCFEVQERLGSGSFGEVFRVKSKEDGKFYAVKKSKEKFRGECDRKRRFEEVKKHEQLPSHPNCVKFYKAWEEKQTLYIQLELCTKSLNECLLQTDLLPEYLVWFYLVDLLKAVKHLHDNGLVHLDIKPENVFISAEGICKLGDFSLAIDLTKGDEKNAIDGDPKYVAPELMQSNFTKAADIFSLGITILEIASDVILPMGGDLWHLLRKGKVPLQLQKYMSVDLKDVLEMMIAEEPSLRPSADELLALPLIKAVSRSCRIWRYSQRLVKQIEDCILRIFLCLWCYCLFVISPIVNMCRRVGSKIEFESPTADSSVLKTFYDEWDQSFSDEDVLDELAGQRAALNFSTDSHESLDDTSFRIPTVRLINSTPTSMRYRQSFFKEGIQVSGRKIDFDRDSPEISQVSSIPDSPYRSACNNSFPASSSFLEDSEYCVRPVLSAKSLQRNLFKMFDEGRNSE